MATLRVEGVGVSFDSVPALADVTLDVPSGEWLALIGPNGAGKTTLLRAVAAALPLEAGAVLLDDRSLLHVSTRDRARHMAVVPQDQDMPLGWTVGEVVSQGRAPHLGAWRREGRADREAVAAALRDTATLELLPRLVETLSGGERQRVLLARALAQTPRLLLLDEPTAFLDLQYQWEMLELVERARVERGLTVVSVLHDLNLAAAFATRLALLKGGRVMATGDPWTVLTEATIAAAYGRRVSIGAHPATGRPTVLSWPTAAATAPPVRVHVISGGGAGAALLRHLTADGHTATAGVLNVGDTDWETARALGLDIADEAPFSAVSPEARARAEALARLADTVIVAPMPIGPGNIENLRLAHEAAARGQAVLLVGAMGPDRDFTGGAAQALWTAAIAAGAIPVPDLAAAMAHLDS
jgi:iron complex transport system ATP-binding protein